MRSGTRPMFIVVFAMFNLQVRWINISLRLEYEYLQFNVLFAVNLLHSRQVEPARVLRAPLFGKHLKCCRFCFAPSLRALRFQNLRLLYHYSCISWSVTWHEHCLTLKFYALSQHPLPARKNNVEVTGCTNRVNSPWTKGAYSWTDVWHCFNCLVFISICVLTTLYRERWNVHTLISN